MKRIIISSIAAATLVTGCVKPSVSPMPEGMGSLELSMSASGDYIVKSGGDNSDVNAFKVSIEGNDGKYSRNWQYADMPAVLELASGPYSIKAESPNQAPAAFEQPVYAASKDFSIEAGAITPLELVCTLQNMKVSVNCSETFLSELQDFRITVTSEAEGSPFLTWTREEVLAGREGYFFVAPLKVDIYGYRAIDNSEATLTYRIKDVAAADHHQLNIDAKVTGQATISLKIDDTTNDRSEDVLVPGFDEIPVEGGDTPGGNTGGDDDPDKPGMPYIQWDANPSFQVLDITPDISVELVIHVPGKAAQFKVSVSDNFKDALYVAAGTDELDLAYPNDQLVESLGGSLPMGDEVLGQTEIEFSLSTLVPMISMVGTPGDDYDFTLFVQDEIGQTLRKTITFHLPE